MDLLAEVHDGAPRAVRQVAEVLAAHAANGLPIEWSEVLSVGIPSIDGQHRVLIAYINQLARALARNQSARVLGEVLAGLEGYAHVHFRYEERLFERLHWSQREEHQRSHRLFESQVAEFRARVAAGDTAIADAVLQFLVHWLTEHILVDDMAYGPLFQDQHVH